MQRWCEKPHVRVVRTALNQSSIGDQSLKDRSVSIKIALDTRPYGIRDFAIVDISGHELVFGQDAY